MSVSFFYLYDMKWSVPIASLCFFRISKSCPITSSFIIQEKVKLIQSLLFWPPGVLRTYASCFSLFNVKLLLLSFFFSLVFRNDTSLSLDNDLAIGVSLAFAHLYLLCTHFMLLLQAVTGMPQASGSARIELQACSHSVLLFPGFRWFHVICASVIILFKCICESSGLFVLRSFNVLHWSFLYYAKVFQIIYFFYRLVFALISELFAGCG